MAGLGGMAEMAMLVKGQQIAELAKSRERDHEPMITNGLAAAILRKCDKSKERVNFGFYLPPRTY
jgi:hypothetical protein